MTDKLALMWMIILKRHIVTGAAVIFTAFFSFLMMLIYDTPNTIFLISMAGMALIAFTMSVEFFIFADYTAENFKFMSANIAHSLAVRLKILAYFCMFSYVLYMLFLHHPLPSVVVQMASTIFMTLLAINLVGLIWVINKSKLIAVRKGLRIIVSVLLGSMLITIIGTEWIGFHRLTNFIITAMATTMFVLFFAWGIHEILMTLLTSLTGVREPWQRAFRSRLGIRNGRSIPEMILIRVGFSFLIWGIVAIYFLDIWGLSEGRYDRLVDSMINGFEVSGLTLIPLRIISAIIIFPLLLLITRWVRQSISVSQDTGLGRGMQNSFASLVGYVGFTFAILFALLLGGANLTGLTLIAGALSIGIGFGLQNIVGNFISGLIILLERPIRPGDRIKVGDIEGWVDSISIRSTVVRSVDRSDVIIPNLTLVTTPVTNLMFGNDFIRLRYFFYIAYGSDTELVSQLLMDAALAHPEVINNDEIQPLVLFNKIAVNALEFELRIVIRDVNKRHAVRSELHFAIDQAFRAHNIKIPFEQRELFIREWPNSSQFTPE